MVRLCTFKRDGDMFAAVSTLPPGDGEWALEFDADLPPGRGVLRMTRGDGAQAWVFVLWDGEVLTLVSANATRDEAKHNMRAWETAEALVERLPPRVLAELDQICAEAESLEQATGGDAQGGGVIERLLLLAPTPRTVH